MNIEEIITRIPNFAAVIGEEWLRRKSDWAEAFISERLPWYEQLERDISILSGHLNIEKLISCYRNSLRNRPQIQKTIFEIHGAGLLASIANKIDLHVSREDERGKNFDVWPEIQGHCVNAESKTRKDEFPFNLLPEPGHTSDIPVYGGVRETMDPHDAVDLGIEVRKPVDDLHHIATPESTVIRQLLLDGLGQLPTTGYNLIIFGHIEGHRYNFEDALYGTEVFEVHSNKTSFWNRAPTGAFSAGPSGEPFKGLTGVLWVRLMPPWPDGNILGRAYKLYLNPCSTPLPDDVIKTLNAVMNQWTTLKEKIPEEIDE